MVSELRLSNRIGDPVMERSLEVVATTTRKRSLSSPEKRESMKEQMDHDVYVLASRLEEEFACVKLRFSRDLVY